MTALPICTIVHPTQHLDVLTAIGDRTDALLASAYYLLGDCFIDIGKSDAVAKGRLRIDIDRSILLIKMAQEEVVSMRAGIETEFRQLVALGLNEAELRP